MTTDEPILCEFLSVLAVAVITLNRPQTLNALSVEVLFWQVPRVRNQEADRLANEAFSGNLNTS